MSTSQTVSPTSYARMLIRAARNFQQQQQAATRPWPHRADTPAMDWRPGADRPRN